MTKSMDYAQLWRQVEGLPWCALVTTGRTGTDFFQSLLDSHPEIFVFNGRKVVEVPKFQVVPVGVVRSA